MAVLLGVDEEQARELLSRAPVVIREPASKVEAEKLHQAISAMRGLVLVETLDGQPMDDDAPGPPGLAALAPEYASPSDDSLERDSSGSTLWIAILGVGMGMFALFMLFWIASAFQEARVERQAEARSKSRQARAGKPVQPEVDVDELRRRVQDLRLRIEQERTELRRAQEMLDDLYKRRVVDDESLRRERVKIMDQRTAFANLNRKFRRLVRELANAENRRDRRK